jgi:hypothetical protein
MPRRALAGTYDEQWARTKKPLLPDDYNPAYALSSPEDQRLDKPLIGGERVELVNMTPDSRLTFEIPRVSLQFTALFGRRREPQAACNLTTLLVEPDQHRLALVWQSTLRVSAPNTEYLDGTEIVDTGSAA